MSIVMLGKGRLGAMAATQPTSGCTVQRIRCCNAFNCAIHRVCLAWTSGIKF
ncbi:hypothetical protein MtrunA17_Chr3g0126691 [Medicago truncatula]|uniref:Uncharacterized protein n=1 Tax=Medicago truncatula TaxID=3880 RepID=A0A396IV73_MEDTR|nr:hypothetical protein MtrunA17_Chr3g0126691 [Medicago truncatula]